MSLILATVTYGRKPDGNPFKEQKDCFSFSAAVGWAVRWIRNHPGSTPRLPETWRGWATQQRVEWLCSLSDGVTFKFISKPAHQILLVHEKHGTRFFYVPEEKDLHAVALKIVKERHANDYYQAPYELEQPDVDEESISSLPKAVQRAAADAWKRYRNDLIEHQRQLDDFNLAEAAVEQNDGEKAWELLQVRSEYEYENCKLEVCESVSECDDG